MDTTYNLLFTGELLPGFEPENVITALVEDMGLAEEKAEKLVNAGHKMVVKRGIDKPRGIQLSKRLTRAGLTVKLIENAAQKPVPEAVPPYAEQPVPEAHHTKQDETNLPPAPSDNPYAAPVANLEQQTPAGDSRKQGAPQKLRAAHGWKWIKDAYSMFKEHPWRWMGAFSLLYFIIVLCNMIPFLGIFVGYMILPVFTGGLMIGAQEQNKGGIFRIGHIFAGFSTNRNHLLLLGVLMTMGLFLCFSPVLLFFGMSFFTGGFTPETMSNVNMAMFPITILISLGLSIPMYMAIWFAPPLVAVNGHNAWTSLKLSFQACKKNMLPFLVYGLAFMVFFGVISGIFGIGAAIILPQFSSPETFGTAAAFMGIASFVVLGSLMVPAMSIMGISVYTGYRDIFYS